MAKNLKPSALLEKAKKHLDVDFDVYDDGVLRFGGRRDLNPYICNAVKLAAGGSAGGFSAPTMEATMVIQHIERLLGDDDDDDDDTLQKWLFRHHRVVALFDVREDFIKLQATRLLWIDDMISYWKAKGE